MDDRENADPQNQKPKTNTGAPLPTAVARHAPDPKQPHSNAVQRQPNAKPEASDPWFKNPDWHMVWVTVLLFAVGVYTAWVFHRQFMEMQSQTKILNDQAKQAAADSIESAKRVEQQLAVADEQAKATESSVKVLQRQMRQDQRAWIKLTSPEPLGTGAGYPIEAKIHMLNTGKTPALDYIGESIIKVFPINRETVFDYTNPDHGHSTGGILYPSDPRDMEAAMYAKEAWARTPQPDKLLLSAQELGAFTAGKSYIVVYSRVTYYDIFGVKHWTHFCNWTSYKPAPAKKCSEYNRVDNN